MPQSIMQKQSKNTSKPAAYNNDQLPQNTAKNTTAIKIISIYLLLSIAIFHCYCWTSHPSIIG
jgi:hypothetical protein